MTSTIFLVAPQVGARTIETARHTVKRIRELFAALEARGHSAAMLATERRWPILGQSVELAWLLEKEAPDNVLWLEAQTERDAYFLLWPKDSFCDWNDFIAVTDAPGISAFVASMGKPTRVDTILCEGGMFVRSGDCVLVSSDIPQNTEIPPGLHSVRLPHPYSSDLYRRHQPEIFPLTHLDIDLALVPLGDDRLLLAGERYLDSYPSFVTDAALRLGLEVVEIPQEEVDRRGLNLVVLSERAVLLPANCPQLSRILTERLGSNSVVELQIDEIFGYNGGRGGLGCMSNLVRKFAVAP